MEWDGMGVETCLSLPAFWASKTLTPVRTSKWLGLVCEMSLDMGFEFFNPPNNQGMHDVVCFVAEAVIHLHKSPKGT
jgi:hypothetical protein